MDIFTFTRHGFEYLPEVDDVSLPAALLVAVLDDVRVASKELSVDSFVERHQVEVLHSEDLLGAFAVVWNEHKLNKSSTTKKARRLASHNPVVTIEKVNF